MVGNESIWFYVRLSLKFFVVFLKTLFNVKMMLLTKKQYV